MAVNWHLIHRSNLIQGILQVILALIIAIVFPLVQESARSKNQQLEDLLQKQENVLLKFCNSVTFAVSMSEDIRACHHRLKCNKMENYELYCKEILSYGNMALASNPETYEAVCRIATVYFSQELSEELDKFLNNMDRVIEWPVFECGQDTSEYDLVINNMINMAYPSIVDKMRGEIQMTRKHLQ
ncbi:hypothetical protein [Desulfolutivibrio sulfoxidireducens]|uniref:hypothetical protein n=1 Tax=Desulfolutivibrio sulfoxidireducens TaxID=2773299 RepID=UPI00159E652E|nr:hypothetical protein [Desulfolutivibrio sulfoxidireducens]QLA15259.1 hypothetical protein GD605_03450 [Desulfolutivibrio sulfoxidireducens]QLA18827.1 hypothetical protein GD604_03330 [Desulfolutivibrio sulfoxidireducens]